MTTYPIKKSDGRILAFEIDNLLLRVRKVASILEKTPGVSSIQVRKPFSSGYMLISFDYMNRPCMVIEPYNDSSRYWVGPAFDGAFVDLGAVESTFAQHPPK